MTEDCRAYFLIRQDLSMSIPKISVQVGHGVDFIHIWKHSNYEHWISQCRKKIVLKIKDYDLLLKIAEKLEADNLVFDNIVDNGLTELNGKTMTGIVIHPLLESKIPKYIKRLQLLK